MSKENDWWTGFFEPFRPVFGIKSRRVTNTEVRYLIRKMNLKPGRSFLDCPCGIGRISLPMAKAGVKVTGVDITASYLEELRTKAARRKLKVATVQRDMRRIDFEEKFDAAGNLWTSLGYFEKESDNLLAVKKMFCALKPGGKFVLHIINRDWIVRNFTPSDWQDLGRLRILESRQFDLATSTSRSTWRFLRGGKERALEATIRMYSYHEVIAMFRAAGFVDVEGFSSVRDEPITFDSRMMWVFGTKPRQSRRPRMTAR